MYFSCMHAAVFTAPTIINSSGSEVCATINESMSVYCLFNASTMVGATIVVWLKDQSKLSGYDNETRPVEGVDNVIISILNTKNFTHEDQGEYTCYCYYNQSMVTSGKAVTSDQATANIYTDCDGVKGKDGSNIPWTMMSIIGGAALAVIGIIAVISTVTCVIRRSKNKYQLFMLVC